MSTAQPRWNIHPEIEPYVEPLRKAGLEVGVMRDSWGTAASTLYVRRDGNIGYISREALYSETGLTVSFCLTPSREHGSAVLMSVPGTDRDPVTVDEVVAAAILATEKTAVQDGHVLPNTGEEDSRWGRPGFEVLSGGAL